MKDRKALPIDRTMLIRLLLGSGVVVSLCLAGLGAFALMRTLTILWLKPGGFLLPSIIQRTTTPGFNALGTPLPVGSEIPTSRKPEEVVNLAAWDGAGRVTVLLLGLDYRDWEAGEVASRSDTMILLTLDPLSNTAGILSIPRDLWVSIPGFKNGKINTAYYLGDAYKLPGGGPALAVKTVEQFLGVPINYYAQIDFGAFVRFIDEIGGVEIDVPAPITIDLLGSGFKTKKKLEPGRQVLPGEWALAYARARYTEGGDFDRAARQQQVIMAIRDRFTNPKALPKMIAKAPTLYEELASGIRTNLSLDDVIKLAVLAQKVPEEGIQKGIIGKESVLFATSPDDLSILIPIPDKIHLLRDQVFASSGGLGPETQGSAQEQMQAEQAKLAIYNGSATPNLAERTSDYLRSQGANIIQVANAGQAYTRTTIVDHTGNPYLLKYLVELLNISADRIFIKIDLNASADVELFLGNDWASRNTLP